MDGSTRVLLWRLEQEASQLLLLCRQLGVACDDLTCVPEKRQRERAAERLLLCHALGHPVTISHDDHGAPVADREALNISITHTQWLVAMAIDRKQVVGVDAESVTRHQVLRVRDKFLNASEQRFIAADDLDAHIVAWTAKEAVIKAERNSALDWTDGIILQPFAMPRPMTGGLHFTARCGNRHYRLETRRVDDHYITLAVPMPSEMQHTGQ